MGVIQKNDWPVVGTNVWIAVRTHSWNLPAGEETVYLAVQRTVEAVGTETVLLLDEADRLISDCFLTEGSCRERCRQMADRENDNLRGVLIRGSILIFQSPNQIYPMPRTINK